MLLDFMIINKPINTSKNHNSKGVMEISKPMKIRLSKETIMVVLLIISNTEQLNKIIKYLLEDTMIDRHQDNRINITNLLIKKRNRLLGKELFQDLIVVLQQKNPLSK